MFPESVNVCDVPWPIGSRGSLTYERNVLGVAGGAGSDSGGTAVLPCASIQRSPTTAADSIFAVLLERDVKAADVVVDEHRFANHEPAGRRVASAAVATEVETWLRWRLEGIARGPFVDAGANGPPPAVLTSSDENGALPMRNSSCELPVSVAVKPDVVSVCVWPIPM